MKTYVLVDRDGVLNRAVRNGYVTDSDGLHVLPRAAQAVAELNRHDVSVLVVSNQQCVGKGLLSVDELAVITQALRDGIHNLSGGLIADFFYCPHLADDDCLCRKPKPGLLLQAQERYGFILADTFFVGDSYSDMATAGNGGCRSIFVLSGLDAQRYRDGEPLPHTPDHVCDDLLDAVPIILGRLSQG